MAINEKQEHDLKQLLKTWGVTFCLFMFIFAGSVGTIISPFKQVVETDVNKRVETALSAGSYEGLTLMGKSWTENPKYFIGMGIVAALALLGAGYSFYQLVNGVKDEKT